MQLARTVLAAAVATVCMAAGAVNIASAERCQPAATRYFDIEANKATSMRALGRHMAEQR